MSKSTRRKFIKGSIAGGIGAGTLSSLPAWANPAGANEDLRIAVIGCGGKGSGHIGGLLGDKGVRIAAICDPDGSYLEKHANRIGDKQGSKPKIYKDYRRLCEDKEIDGVMIATPNHLHTTIAIRAAQHGKHVYVEKPVSHNMWEGAKLVEAAEKYGKEKGVIIQHGMQRRSDTGWWEIMDYLADKNCPIGKVTLSRGLCYKPRKSIGKVSGPQEPPAHIDYNLWSGPREVLPIMRQRFHYDWHWQWPYGNGDTGNQGPHQMDVARWALGQETLPKMVMSVGGRLGYVDDGTTPNTHISYFDYPIPLIFETRGLPNRDMDWGKGMPNYKGGRVSNVIHCEGGYIVESKAYDNDGKSIKKFPLTGGRGHRENWIKSIREGKHDPRWNASTGHLSAALCHMANTSYRIGKPTKAEEIKKQIGDNELFQETFERMQEHLAANNVDLKMTLPTWGGLLKMNPDTLKFSGPGADEANKIERGSYRKEFEVPETV